MHKDVKAELAIGALEGAMALLRDKLPKGHKYSHKNNNTCPVYDDAEWDEIAENVFDTWQRIEKDNTDERMGRKGT